jgi:hypothetical protein
MRRGLLDPTEPMGGLLEGGWSQSPELVDRMSMLPIGQYEDGGLTLAWPGMLKDMYEGAVRSYEQGRQLPRVDEQGNYAGTPRAEPLDAFNAASIAPMAGVAGRVTGGIPRGALGSGGSDMLTKAAANDSRAALPGVLVNGVEQPQGIRAYHGSPHDFDRFSMDHVGSGEGAQAYGRGLYFAEAEDVARNYRDALSGGTGSPGHMYEVNINAQPDSFLDWDRPLGEQGSVFETVRSVIPDIDPADRVSQAVTKFDTARDAAIRDQARREGRGFSWVTRQNAEGDRQAYSQLANAGIPGIRYLDQMSRGAGEGSRNYTVFDDSLIDIMRKYANPETSSLPSLLLQGQEEDTSGLMQFANADPAYDADALVREQWQGLPFVQGDPSAYNAGHVDPFQIQQQMMIDPLEHWFRPQQPNPPPLFR